MMSDGAVTNDIAVDAGLSTLQCVMTLDFVPHRYQNDGVLSVYVLHVMMCCLQPVV